MKKFLIVLIILILIALVVSWGPIMSNVEQAKYTVVQHDGAIEIRDYAPMIIAEVDVAGDRKAAINNGFRRIADYIFGNNISKKKVAMTAPVTQEGSGSGYWKVHFVMPAVYTLETLPKPHNDSVKLKEIPTKRYAVIRFSGIATQQRLDREQKALEAFIAQQGLQPIAAPVYAFFNPPWTLPFFRRNEVMIEIEK